MKPNDLPPAPLWVRGAARFVRLLPFGRYRAIHALPRRHGAFRMRLPQTLGGYSFRCDLRDSISREVCFTGRYEPQETAILRMLLAPGMTFVDVGANWGYHSLLAAHLVGPTGRVLSLEPDPRSFAALQDNLEVNALHQVKALCVAAADAVGEVSLAGYQESDGNYGVSKIVPGDQPSGTFAVESRPLDLVLQDEGVGQVEVLKMDIEGGEDLALRGLERSLKDHQVRRLLLEVHPELLAERGRTVGQVLELLTRHGYQGWRIDHSPSATRRTAYAAQPAWQDLLQPLVPGGDLDSWPHLLWLAPDCPLAPLGKEGNG
jgi:FkbM family methyltransferase